MARLSKDFIVSPHQPDTIDLVAEAACALKHRTSAAGEQPSLYAWLSVPASESQSNAAYDFVLKLRTAPSPSLLKSSTGEGGIDRPQVEINVSRHIWTEGIENPSFGDRGGFRWPGERIAIVTEDRRFDGRVSMTPTEDGLEWKGSIKLPFVQIAHQGCAFSIRVRSVSSLEVHRLDVR